ncbi:antibiotic biosynthesis monooxygenase [Mesorhizobium sp. M0408]|uniref:antibiotic biosynthesis monooxygenase n=1 Tax=Mesorhizobium sp. M0408 TaxID=2956942 RepID=UPI00333D80AF
MKKEEDYTTSFVVKQSPEEVFAAVVNPRAWWSEDIDGDTNKLGAIFYYHFKDIHRGTFKVTELVPGKKVVWHVVLNYFNFVKDATEWTGTDVVFEIAPTEKGTELRFTHVGLKPSEECYDVCHDSWRFYVASLRDLISTGKGQPNKGEENANPTVVPQNEDLGAAERKAAGDGAGMIVMTTAAAKPGIESKVRNALRDVAGAARKQSGCIDYSVFRSEAEPHVTICVERWASKQERDAFLRSADAKNFVSAITGAFLERPSPISYATLEVGS